MDLANTERHVSQCSDLNRDYKTLICCKSSPCAQLKLFWMVIKLSTDSYTLMQHFRRCYWECFKPPAQIFGNLKSLLGQRIQLKEHPGVQGQKQTRWHAGRHGGAPLTLHYTYLELISDLKWPLVYVFVVISV